MIFNVLPSNIQKYAEASPVEVVQAGKPSGTRQADVTFP